MDFTKVKCWLKAALKLEHNKDAEPLKQSSAKKQLLEILTLVHSSANKRFLEILTLFVKRAVASPQVNR